MEDLYFDKTVKRDNGPLGKVFPVVSIIAAVLFIVFFNAIPILMGVNIIYFTGMVSLGVGYLVYRANVSLRVEYQIEITNDQFELTKITNNKKNDLLADFSIKEAEYIGCVTSDRFNDDLSKSEFCVNATALKQYCINENNWYIFITQNKTSFIIVFPFDEEMYPIFRRYNPRGTMKHDS